MIEFSRVEIRYPDDTFHLRIPFLRVDTKEKLAVIGPSGSGKTTLMNVIAGIHLPENGEVHVGETVVNNLTDTARRQFRLANIGFVFQDFGLIEYLSTLDNILHPYRINNALELNDIVRKRAYELAESLAVERLLRKFPGTLSQGEKQRVAICRALLTQPQLILADEATGNLDPENKIKILELLCAAVDSQGATLIAVTHDHALLPYFDRVIRMDEITGLDD
jgi:putative ABC transport system ATP-binding protein